MALSKRASRKAIADLVPDPQNRMGHNARNLGMTADALKEVGAARSIVIDEDDVILAGNGVTQAALQVGLTQVRIIEADGQELIAVRRRNLTPEQKRALAIFDNRTAQLAEWNFEQLAADQAAGLSLQPYWSAEEEAALFGTPKGDASSLIERFGVPPFSVLDARQGYWQTRKAAWIALGIESELGRGAGINNQSRMALELAGGFQDHPAHKAMNLKGRKARLAPGGSPRPAMKLKGGKTVRGDGRGRELA